MLLWSPFSPRMAVVIKQASQSMLNPLTRTSSEMPLLKFKGHSYTDCRARHCQLFQEIWLLWQWQEIVDLKFGSGLFPSEKHGEETGSGEGESCRPFQHLSVDTALLLPAALPQGMMEENNPAWVRSCFSKGFVTAVRGVLFVAGTIYIFVCVCVD